MSLAIPIDIGDAVSPRIGIFLAGMKSKAALHEAVGLRARNLTRDHLIRLAATRHATAQRLGATPTGHWAQAAEKTRLTSDNGAATVTVNHPGIGRAGHDVTIKPRKPDGWLTIPVIAAAYGVRARRIPGLVPIFTGKGAQATGVLMLPKKGTDFGTVYYVLTRSIFQKQDRTLLPSDEAFRVAALEGVRDYVEYLIARATPGLN